MKRWCKIFVLCLVFSITTILIACRPTIDAMVDSLFLQSKITDNSDSETTTSAENFDSQTELPTTMGTELSKNSSPDVYNKTNIPEPCHSYETCRVKKEANCTETGLTKRFCLICGVIETNVISATTRDFYTNLYRYKNCHQLSIELPIQNLKGSFWYLKDQNDWTIHQHSWAICFETEEILGANLHRGKYFAYNGSLTDGKFTTDKTEYIYYGTYDLYIDVNQETINYTIKLNDKYCDTDFDFDCGTEFLLNYIINQDETSGLQYYSLDNTSLHLFSKRYENSTLIFAGYGV